MTDLDIIIWVFGFKINNKISGLRIRGFNMRVFFVFFCWVWVYLYFRGYLPIRLAVLFSNGLKVGTFQGGRYVRAIWGRSATSQIEQTNIFGLLERKKKLIFL